MEFLTKKQTQSPSWQWVLLIIVFLALSRLIPHAPNFTPIGAMALLAGIYFKNIKLALIAPLAAMLISDFILGFHSTMFYVYAAVALIIISSRWLIKYNNLLTILCAATGAAIIFYIVTNFGAWLSHDMYPRSVHGLQQAYIAGIPFFRNTLSSQLLFTVIGFYAMRQLPEDLQAINNR